MDFVWSIVKKLAEGVMEEMVAWLKLVRVRED